MSEAVYKPVVLIIVDGWGLSVSWGGNAISTNSPTFMNSLWRQYPHAILGAALLDDRGRRKIGNSEVGHASIGAGRLVPDDLSDINEAIKSGVFYNDLILLDACQKVKSRGAALHIVGMLSEGEVNGNLGHVEAMLDLAIRQGVKRVGLHLITDGIDDKPMAGTEYVAHLNDFIKSKGGGVILTLCGRHYAMDLENHLDRTAIAYKAQALGETIQAESALQALSVAYRKGYTDETLPPVVIMQNGKMAEIDGRPMLPMAKDDIVVMTNWRGDGLRQLASAYVNPAYFKDLKWQGISFVGAELITFTDYRIKPKPTVAFPSQQISDILAEILAKNGLRQLHAAESIKDEHVTFFFNGGRNEPFDKEDRIILPSLDWKEIEKQPEMAAKQLSERVAKALESGRYEFVVVNFANLDSVAHTGNILATNMAVRIVDEAIKTVVEATLRVNGAVVITADHGNAEQMIYKESNTPQTTHTDNPVPLILITKDNHHNLMESAMKPPIALLGEILHSQETLADVAPTILELLGLEKPVAMTGNSLITKLV